MQRSAFPALLVVLLFVVSSAAQDRVAISEKIQLSPAPLPDGAATPELNQGYSEFFKALEAELKSQAGGFNPECQWNIIVKLVVRPKSKIVEITLEPKGNLSPRIFTTGFLGKASFENEEAYKEHFKTLAKTIVSRASGCAS